MARPTEAFHEEHRALLEHIEHLRTTAREFPDLSDEERAARLDAILGFLRETLIPHAEAEERFLYPKVASILGDPRATATMSRDHVAVRQHLEALAATDVADATAVEELLFGLYALIIVHFAKEEEVYLPILDGEPEDELRGLFSEMAQASGHEGH